MSKSAFCGSLGLLRGGQRTGWERVALQDLSDHCGEEVGGGGLGLAVRGSGDNTDPSSLDRAEVANSDSSSQFPLSEGPVPGRPAEGPGEPGEFKGLPNSAAHVTDELSGPDRKGGLMQGLPVDHAGVWLAWPDSPPPSGGGWNSALGRLLSLQAPNSRQAAAAEGAVGRAQAAPGPGQTTGML